MRAILGSQFFNQAPEVFDRLGALERVALVEDEERRATDAMLASQAEIKGDLFFAEAGGKGVDQLSRIERNVLTLE